MSFSFLCSSCPMKFMNEADLQIHGQVHVSSRQGASLYDFDSSTEPLFNEFLTAFFPETNDSYIPALNDFRRDWTEEVPSNLLSADDDITYTTLTPMKIPSDDSEQEIESDSSNSGSSSSIPAVNRWQSSAGNLSSIVLKKLPPVRFVNVSSVQPRSSQFDNAVKPVYLARRPPSIAMVQHHYGDDRIERYSQYHRTNLLQPAILTKCTPSIARISNPTPDVDGNHPELLGITTDPAKRGLKRSRKTNIGEKPYTCEVCNKRFAFIKKFIAHKRIHIVGKLFSCHLCHKRFGYSYKLNQHMRQHTGENAEECNSCKKTYKNLIYLRRHRCRGISTKTTRNVIAKSRPYSCTICKRTFGRINYLNLHKRCHKQDPRNHERVLPTDLLQVSWD